jgi:hypothetical protein
MTDKKAEYKEIIEKNKEKFKTIVDKCKEYGIVEGISYMPKANMLYVRGCSDIQAKKIVRELGEGYSIVGLNVLEDKVTVNGAYSNKGGDIISLLEKELRCSNIIGDMGKFVYMRAVVEAHNSGCAMKVEGDKMFILTLDTPLNKMLKSDSDTHK